MAERKTEDVGSYIQKIECNVDGSDKGEKGCRELYTGNRI